jgi:hypothetical protein
MHTLESKVPNCEKYRTVSVVTAFIPISCHKLKTIAATLRNIFIKYCTTFLSAQKNSCFKSRIDFLFYRIEENSFLKLDPIPNSVG